jgi:hypothetical protein
MVDVDQVVIDKLLFFLDHGMPVGLDDLVLVVFIWNL